MGFGGPHAGYMSRAAGPRAHDARPPRRRLGRRRRPPGIPAGPADPRAAHPPREGDLQHLHRAGAARRDGQHVCRLPRPRRARARSPAGCHAHARGAAPTACATGGVDVADRRVLRHRHGAGPGPGRRGASTRPLAAGVNLRRVDDDTVAAEHRRDHRPATTSCRGARRRSACVAADRCGIARPGVAATALVRTSDYLTHPVFSTHHCETAMLRYLRRLADRDFALDRGDDPARLLHDEAQRDHRDGGGHLAGVRQPAPVRAARARPRASAA